MLESLKHPSESPSESVKRQKIIKSWKMLLSEVFSGEFKDFRAYLIQEKISDITLVNKGINDQKVALLGKALKGTLVTTVNLSYNYIGDVGAKEFAEALKGTHVTMVDLSDNLIGDTGAKDFADALKDTLVTTVNLRYNKIGDAGAKDIADALKDTLVSTVNLRYNKIGDAGAKGIADALKGAHITTLNLEGNVIGDAGADYIASAIPGTCLVNYLGYKNDALKKALWLNQQKIILTPYYLACLRFMSPAIKQECIPTSKVAFPLKSTGELAYAGGILMNLPPEIMTHINSFLPGMATKLKNTKTRAQNYTELSHQNKGGNPTPLSREIPLPNITTFKRQHHAISKRELNAVVIEGEAFIKRFDHNKKAKRQ